MQCEATPFLLPTIQCWARIRNRLKFSYMQKKKKTFSQPMAMYNLYSSMVVIMHTKRFHPLVVDYLLSYLSGIVLCAEMFMTRSS